MNIERNFNVATLRGGGDLILGQDQDEINAGRLDPNQAYKLVFCRKRNIYDFVANRSFFEASFLFYFLLGCIILNSLYCTSSGTESVHYTALLDVGGFCRFSLV